MTEDQPSVVPREPAAAQVASALAVNAVAGTLFAWSILLDPVGEDLDVAADDLGVVFSASLLVFAAAVLLGGGPADRHGPARTATLAGLLSSAGLLVAAGAPGLPVLVAGYGLMFGAGSGLAYLAAVSWAGTRGGRRRTRVIGLVVAAYAAGPVLAAPLGALGVEALGWRPTLLLAAVLVAAVMLPAARRLPGPLRRHVPGTATAARGSVGDPVSLLALWVLFLGTAAPGLLGFAYAARVATERGLSSQLAALVVALMAAGNLLGRLLAAPVADATGLLGCLWVVLATIGGSLAALGWGSAVLAVSALPVLAVGYGMVSAALPAATREVSGDVRFGAAYGRVFSSFGVAGIVGPYVGAVLHVGGDGYAGGFRAWSAGVAVGAVALLVLGRRSHAAAPAARR